MGAAAKETHALGKLDDAKTKPRLLQIGGVKLPDPHLARVNM